MKYSDSGVNVDLGDVCSKIMYAASRKTWKNRKGKPGEIKAGFDDFSGLRYFESTMIFNLTKLNPKKIRMIMNLDGVGSKIEIAERLSSYSKDFSCHKGIAFDLFAMLCDDAIIRGFEPALIGTILDVNKLNVDLVKALAIGMIDAANASGVSVVNGEIAELGSRVGGFGEFCYNWGGSLVSYEFKPITGKQIRPGNAVIALKEEGFRSNGLSLVRKIMQDSHGEKWHEKEVDGKNLAELCLTPSKIYCKQILKILESSFYGIKGMAHITGGGIPSKLGRILKPTKLGADLVSLYEPPEIMRYCQELGKVEDEEAYRTWNMGNGMLLITNNPGGVLSILKEYGLKAKYAGEISKKPGIRIKSKGAKHQNLEY